ncbi:exosome non-catalytic core subunit rrp40 [Podochytrium sp. JEL0797]|nr:exosome non-catalytic core subunit rrp40 [Podochytrium sp. JEL0797]
MTGKDIKTEMDIDDDQEPKTVIVLPGDLVPIAETDQVVRVGPGLRQELADIVVSKAGILKQGAGGDRVWVEGNQRRYVPSLNESVIGIVTAKHVEGYRVDIGGAHPATLGALSFEGATKRNKPTLEIGTLVYARVCLANKDMDPELDCINPSNGKADGFGEMKGGFMFKCSLGLARSLLDPSNPFLQYLGQICPFEVAAGMNGRVWVNAETSKQTIVLVKALLGCEAVPYGKAKAYVKEFKSDLTSE